MHAGKYIDGKRPWALDGGKYDIALPCATQNEIEIDDAKALVKAGCKLVAEGANMPSTSEAIDHYHENKVEYGPAKVSPYLMLPPASLQTPWEVCSLCMVLCHVGCRAGIERCSLHCTVTASGTVRSDWMLVIEELHSVAEDEVAPPRSMLPEEGAVLPTCQVNRKVGHCCDPYMCIEEECRQGQICIRS